MTPPSRIELPDPPDDQAEILAAGGVACWEQAVPIRTYQPGEPDPFPQFFSRRVYQGASGATYPLPLIDRIDAEPIERSWRAIHLENAHLRLMLLPEIGGRIHIAYDKHRGYDLFYRNNVIKPALVGLAGPWISGGVEFNWPQHHRPATFLPTEVRIEREASGAVVVWHGDLDPLQRMQGAHGIRLQPGAALIEVLGRLHNRTPEPQTFLWWANVAAAVGKDYESFFPPDVRYVADHARRAVVAFPEADRPYYGVDYPHLPRRDLSRYSDIPVPTSYMITDTTADFFGGYDHAAGAGFVHWADRIQAPGKKQWTWGNGPLGWAWDRQLTDEDGPYIELMAGVFTDNQPDFSYLAPGETRTFSQRWYPIAQIGPVCAAGPEVALALRVHDGVAHLGLCAARELRVLVEVVDGAGDAADAGAQALTCPDVPVSPARPWTHQVAVSAAHRDDLRVLVRSTTTGEVLVRWNALPEHGAGWVATEPPAPSTLDSPEELTLIATHLTQNRHPTRNPDPYLHRALHIDPADTRAHLALAWREMARGHLLEARDHALTALERLTARNLNPRSGEAHYVLALATERLGDLDPARDAYAKAAWDGAWALAAHLGAAACDLRTGNLTRAREHAAAAHRIDPGNPAAIVSLALAMRRGGDSAGARSLLEEAHRRDGLDPLVAAFADPGRFDPIDPRTLMEMAHAARRLGEIGVARTLAERARDREPTPFGYVAPMACYLLAAVDPARAAQHRAAAARLDPELAFPAGLEDLAVLREAIVPLPGRGVGGSSERGEDAGAALGYLGCWLLGAGLPGEALVELRAALAAGADHAVVHRNAAIAEVNSGGDLERAAGDLAAAQNSHRAQKSRANPRLILESDALAVRRERPAADRLAALTEHREVLSRRDDLALVHAELLLAVGRSQEALALLTSRAFRPFEGGEGRATRAYDDAVLAEAARMQAAGRGGQAVALLEADIAPEIERADSRAEGAVWLRTPDNLGEGRHPADPMARRLLAAGDAQASTGQIQAARHRWEAARTQGGRLAVAPRPARPDDHAVGIAHLRLGEQAEAVAVADSLAATADQLEAAAPEPDYFATSLPDLLVFDVDDPKSRAREVSRLRALAADLRRQIEEASC